MLNRKQALALFQKEAVYFDGEDGVPLFRARKLFGRKAITFALERHKNVKAEDRCFGVFCTEKCLCEYLNLRGFLYAVAYVNMEEMKAHAGKYGVRLGMNL